MSLFTVRSSEPGICGASHTLLSEMISPVLRKWELMLRVKKMDQDHEDGACRVWTEI